MFILGFITAIIVLYIISEISFYWSLHLNKVHNFLRTTRSKLKGLFKSEV